MEPGRRRKAGAGFRTGKLTVTAPTKKRKNRYMVWECRCDCGGQILLDTCCLQRGNVRDCGCLQSGMYREPPRLVDGTSVAMLEAHKKKLNCNNISGYAALIFSVLNCEDKVHEHIE